MLSPPMETEKATAKPINDQAREQSTPMEPAMEQPTPMEQPMNLMMYQVPVHDVSRGPTSPSRTRKAMLDTLLAMEKILQ